MWFLHFTVTITLLVQGTISALLPFICEGSVKVCNGQRIPDAPECMQKCLSGCGSAPLFVADPMLFGVNGAYMDYVSRLTSVSNWPFSYSAGAGANMCNNGAAISGTGNVAWYSQECPPVVPLPVASCNAPAPCNSVPAVPATPPKKPCSKCEETRARAEAAAAGAATSAGEAL